MSKKKHLLILAGTREARSLAEMVADSPNWQATVSLAGVSPHPKPFPCLVRIGSFGGVEALEKWLLEREVDTLIDATHPFAAKITTNATAACKRANIRYARIVRPPWSVANYNHLREFSTLEQAANSLPTGARIFLPLGGRHIQPFLARRDIWFALRSLHRPAKMPKDAIHIVAEPPHSFTEEYRLMKSLQLTHMIVRNSGGTKGLQKITAAQQLGLEIWMIRRPKLPRAKTFTQANEALYWLTSG